MPVAARMPTKTRRPAETFLGPERTWNIGGSYILVLLRNEANLLLFQIDAYIIEMKKKSKFTPVLLVLGPFSDRA
jgi:hypothetical protein